DRSDYAPGATAALTGASWQPGEAVHIEVTDASGGTWNYSTNVNANSSGAFTTQFQLSSTAIATDLATPTGLLSGTATTSFTDAEQQELNQCQNGGIGKPLVACQNSAWANGNAGKSNSHWAEDEFIPYRAVLKELNAGTHTLVVSYDTVFGEKHALDYLGSFDATETTSEEGTELHANKNNPCLDIFTGLEAEKCKPKEPAAKREIPSPTLKNCGKSSGSAPEPIPGLDPEHERLMKLFGPALSKIESISYGKEEEGEEEGKKKCAQL